MNIHVGSGIGTGPTELAAFDAALYDAGIANYNLLAHSSVISSIRQVTGIVKAALLGA